MTVDTGGIDYSILVKDQFSSNLANFKTEVNKAKQEWIAFREELQAGTKGASRGRGKAKEARESSRRAKRQAREETRKFNARAAGIAKVNNETRKQATNQAAAEVTSKRQFTNEKRLLTVTEQRQAAEKRLTAELNKERRVEQNLAAVRARGREISERVALKLGLASKVRLGRAKKLTELETKKLALQKATSLANNKELSQITAQTAALRIKAAAQQRAAVAGILRSQGLDARGNVLPPPGKIDGIRKSLDGANNSANRISFTFRRLFGILAAFTAARLAVGGFNSLVKDSITLNAELEQSVLGVGALITALGDVVGPSGKITDNAERLAAAQGEARRQLELLRVDALKTAATYSELSETFQVALAPGFQAGLDLDEIRRLTIRISQAAGAVGLPQDQLPQEIRSLLTGNISPRNTRIATSLGITNEDIRKAKEAGNLVDFLEKRFAAFAQAGEEALGTFDAISTNLKDGLSQILRLGGLDFFNELKASLKETLSLVAQTNEEGFLVFNEDAIAVVKEITDGLKEAVIASSGVGEAFDFRSAQNIARILGKTIEGIAKTSAPILKSLLAVLSGVGEVIGFITSLGIVNDLVFSILGRSLAIVVAAKTLIFLWSSGKAALLALSVPLRGISLALAGIQAQTLTIARGMVLLRASLLGIVPALAIASFAFFSMKTQAEEVQFASQALSDSFRQLPSAIAESTQSLEDQKELAKELRDEFTKAADAFEVSIGTAGLSGAIEAQTRAVIEQRQRLRDLEQKAAADQRVLVEKQLRLQEKQEEAREKRIDLKKSEPALIQEVSVILEKVQRKEERVLDLRRRISALADEDNERSKQLTEQLREQSEELRKQQKEAENHIVRRRALQIAEERRAAETGTGRILRGAEIATEVITTNLFAILERRFDNLTDRFKVGALKVGEEEIAAANQELEAFQRTLSEEKKIETEIEGIKFSQAEAQRAKNQLTSEGNQLIALRNRLEAESLLGPFVKRTSKEELAPVAGITPPTPQGSVVSFVNEENELLRTQVANRKRLEAAEKALGNVRRAETLNELRLAEHVFAFQNKAASLELSTLQTRREENEANQASAESRLSELLSLERTDEVQEDINLTQNEQILLRQEALALEQQHEVLAERIALKYGEQKAVIEKINEDLEKQRDTVANIFVGIKDGLQEAEKKVGTTAEIAARVMVSTVEGAAKLISDTIVDAFDPTKDSTLEQRIGQFFQSIARQILQLTTMALILRSALGVGGGGGLTALGRLVTGAADGGLIGHGGAKGYASGGTVGMSSTRPAGLPASDTVPIWATPGEFMVKKRAVNAYGADTIAAINNMLVDPGSLRSLAGLTRRRRSSGRRSGAGFALGGAIPADTGDGGSGAAGTQMPIVVPLPADNATMEALLNGGQGAMFAFAQSNRRRFRSALGIQ